VAFVGLPRSVGGVRPVYHVRRPGWQDRGFRPVKLFLDALACIAFGLTFIFFLWALGGAPVPS